MTLNSTILYGDTQAGTELKQLPAQLDAVLLDSLTSDVCCSFERLWIWLVVVTRFSWDGQLRTCSTSSGQACTGQDCHVHRLDGLDQLAPDLSSVRAVSIQVASELMIGFHRALLTGATRSWDLIVSIGICNSPFLRTVFESRLSVESSTNPPYISVRLTNNKCPVPGSGRSQSQPRC